VVLRAYNNNTPTDGLLPERLTYSIVHLKKLRVAQLVNKFYAFNEPEDSVTCSQQTATGL